MRTLAFARSGLAPFLGLTLCAGLTLFSCARAPERGGTAHVYVGISSAGTMASNVTQVLLQISASDLTNPINATLTQANNNWVGVINDIPAGSAREFTATAEDITNTPLYGGSVTMDITDGQTVLIAIIAQDLNPTTPLSNAAPIILSVSAAEQTAAPGQLDALAVVATDLDPNGMDDTSQLAYRWSSDQGSFQASPVAMPAATASTATTNFVSQADGTYTVTIQVTDPQGQYSALSFDLSTSDRAGQGTLDFTASFNTWPSVTQMIVSPAQVAIGGNTSVQAIASDPDGDPLGYAWSIDSDSLAAGCAGTFSPAAAQTTFSATAAPSTLNGLCTLRVDISDGRGGSNFGTVGVYVQPPTVATYDPQIDNVSAVPTQVLGGEPVNVFVTAHDANPQSFSFAFSSPPIGDGTPYGRFGEVTIIDNQPGSQTASVLWYPPCVSNNGTAAATATVTVTNSAGEQNSQTFQATTSCASSCGQLQAASQPSGPYPIDPQLTSPGSPINVYCEMDNSGFALGGWAQFGKLAGDAMRDPSGLGYSGASDFTGDSFPSGLSPGSLTANSLADSNSPVSMQDDHYTLYRFADWGQSYTVRSRVEVRDGSHQLLGYQYSFWTPASNGGGIATTQSNWITGTYVGMTVLQYSTVAGAPPFPNPINFWPIYATGWDDSGEDGFVFGYRDSANPAPCISPSGQTQECQAPSGIYLTQPGITGSNTSAASDNDGVTHSWGNPVTYWITNSNGYASAGVTP